MKRCIPLLLATALLLGACGSSGKPETFYEQTAPLPEILQVFENELLDGVNPSQVPLVQRNFLEGCMGGQKDIFNQLSGAALARACGCSYTELVNYLELNATDDQPAFDTFKKINKTSNEEGGVLGKNYKSIFEECLARV
tara:strand:- start:241 stop:660 length:420 start_codon:yes stop_codon:yes gene_type:complete